MIFKDCLLQAHKKCITTKKKSVKKSRKFAWMNKELLDRYLTEAGRRDRCPVRNTVK